MVQRAEGTETSSEKKTWSLVQSLEQGRDLIWIRHKLFSTGCLAPKPSRSGLVVQMEEHGLSVPRCACQVRPWVEQTEQMAWGLPTGDTGPPTRKLPQPPDKD